MRIGRTRGTVAIPLAALTATAVVAIAMAACSGLALCRRRMEFLGPGDTDGGIDLCPIVVGLIVLAASLALWTAMGLLLDPHRSVSRHRVLDALARLPLARSIASLAVVSAVPIGVMTVSEAQVAPSLGTWLVLAALIAGGSALATLAATLLARVAIALCTRLVVRIAGRARSRRAPRLCIAQMHARAPRVGALGHVCVLSAGLGLRAPPHALR